MNIQSQPTPNSLALYIHWPWCLKKCPYCDFNSHVAQKDETDDYVDTLIADMQSQATYVGKRDLVSIFFGGGTPSLMRPDQVERILSASKELFNWQQDIEITLEANPTSSNLSKFKEFKAAGINRLSIGVQSLHDDYLKFLGREHNTIDAKETIEYANNTFNNVNIDLIYGLPKQDLNLWIDDLSYVNKLGTTHVSAYQLTIEPNTKFFGEVKKKKWSPLDDDRQADFYEATTEHLKSHNIHQYEISNYARDGYDCKHNTHIWQYGDYLGIGAGAHGRHKNQENKRIFVQNFKMPEAYKSNVKRVEHSHYTYEEILQDKEYIEYLLSGLRLLSGVQFNEQLSKNIDLQALNRLIFAGMMYKDNTKIGVTEKGAPLLESILCDLISY